MSDSEEREGALEREAGELMLARFDHHVAWALGTAIRERALELALPVVIDIRTPTGAVYFHCALPGTSADQEDWVRRKSATVFRFGVSSALVGARMDTFADAGIASWLDAGSYALAGGGVPVVVSGAGVVACITVSGSTSEVDHDLGVWALRQGIARH